MIKYKLYICAVTSLLFVNDVRGHCIDLNSQVVSQGLHYVPGPNPCTLCICDKGSPKWCKSVLCSPPQNCKSFQVGNSCCEFKCLDDLFTSTDNYKTTYELAFRVIGSAVTAIVSLSLLFFLLHRLRKRKLRIRQNRQLTDDHRSLNSIGYIAGSLGYLSGNIGYIGSGNSNIEFHYEESNTHYSLWKPPGNYFPRDEAPPPYEEAVRTAQVEEAQVHAVNTPLPAIAASSHQNALHLNHQAPQQSMPSIVQCRHEYAINNFSSSSHEYSNVSVPNIAVYQNCPNNASNAPKIENNSQDRGSRGERSKSYENMLTQSKTEHPSCSSRTKTDATMDHAHRHAHTRNHVSYARKSDAKMKSEAYKNNTSDKNGYYENIKHRTIPTVLDYGQREDRNAKETMPRSGLQKSRYGDRSESNLKNLTSLKEFSGVSAHSTLPKNMRDLIPADDVSSLTTPLTYSLKLHSSALEAAMDEPHTSGLSAAGSSCGANETKADTSQAKTPSRDEKRSFISYQYLSSQDEDDYRSECENCKSSGLPNLDDDETDVLNETMTLQRRPLEPTGDVPYYRTSLTLPTNTKKPRTVIQNPGRESWFVAMQETSSSDDSD